MTEPGRESDAPLERETREAARGASEKTPLLLIGGVAGTIAVVVGITFLDYWCAKRLGSGRPHGSVATHRANVADGTAPHYRESEAAPSR